TDPVRGHGERPNDAVLVVALLNDGLEGAGNSNPVTAHDAELALAGIVEEERVERLAVFGAELEEMPDLDGAADFERFAAFGTRFARVDSAKVGPLRDLDIALHRDIVDVKPVFIRPGRHAVGTAQPFVGVHRPLPRFLGQSAMDSPQASGIGTERGE